MNFHKLKFEHWPWKVTYFPIFIQHLFQSALERNFFYFYSVNPGIETGGLLIESKYDILQQVPKTYRPAMKLVKLQDIQLTKFPVIIKPNYGERGTHVEKIENEKDFIRYKEQHPHDRDYIVQEYIDLPYEAGVFYYRFPNKKTGVVSSVVVKEFLSITGDGEQTMRELINENHRAREQLDYLEEKFDLDTVPEHGEIIQLIPIGNHCRGTTFLDGNHLISDKLIETFDKLAKQIPGFFYGRFDVRATSIEAIYEGRFKILELNGAKSEPAHIYHPRYPIHKAYKSLTKHWSVMRQIARENKKQGHHYPTFKEGMQGYKKYKQFH